MILQLARQLALMIDRLCRLIDGYGFVMLVITSDALKRQCTLLNTWRTHCIVKDNSLATELNERHAREKTLCRRRVRMTHHELFAALEQHLFAIPCCQLLFRFPMETAVFRLRSRIKTLARSFAREY